MTENRAYSIKNTKIFLFRVLPYIFLVLPLRRMPHEQKINFTDRINRMQRESSTDIMERIFLLIVAHPDDESMFFFPILNAITNSRKGNNNNTTLPKIMNGSKHTKDSTYILCLSNGGYDKLGHVREKEMYNACKKCYGLDRNHVKVINNDKMQDNPFMHWNENIVADTIQSYIQEIVRDRSSCIINNQMMHYEICIFTFDNYGVSGHLNHIFTSHGVKKLLLKQQQGQHNNSKWDIRAFELISIKKNLLRKYFFLIDWCYYKLFGESKYQKSINLLIILTFNPFNAWRAMSLHASQFVWYRKLSVLFSRYCYVNTFKEITL